MSGYLTVARDAEAEIEVRRSRFLCTVVRVEDEAGARAVVDRMRRTHWDARHHCSAFVLGPPPAPVERSSDDGEPAGTAGAPMLEVLRGHGGAGVSDVVAVVTRWFGGVLLGSGGLMRAYGGTAALCLRSAEKIPLIAKTTDGDIYLDGNFDRIDASANDGKFILTLPADADADIVAPTEQLSINGVAVTKSEDGKAKLGKGGRTYKFTSVDGTVEVRNRESLSSER